MTGFPVCVLLTTYSANSGMYAPTPRLGPLAVAKIPIHVN